MPAPSGETTLYRLYAEDGTLLYVGVSCTRMHRFKQHAGEKSWWHSVSTIKLEHHPNHAVALDAEARAILAEQPLHNRAGIVPRKATPKREYPPVVPPLGWYEMAKAAAAEKRRALHT